MKILKTCLIGLALLLIATSSSTHVVVSEQHKKIGVIDFTKDFQRLTILQKKYLESTNAVDKYTYSSAMIEYTERLLEHLKEVNAVYYQPAMLIMTGEIPDPRDPQFTSPLNESIP